MVSNKPQVNIKKLDFPYADKIIDLECTLCASLDNNLQCELFFEEKVYNLWDVRMEEI